MSSQPRHAGPLLLLLLAACGGSPAPPPAQPAAERPPFRAAYYPPPAGEWARRTPAEAGMFATLLDRAVEYARAHETTWPTDVRVELERRLGGARGALLGPVRDRGEPNGLILRNGYIVAEWGDTERVDMAFGVTKAFLAAVAGIALDRGAIANLSDPVRRHSADGGFDSPHNARITWHQLLNQTSEWEGVLFGVPDAATRRGGARGEPGTVWADDEVRANRLALSLLQVWKRPLPQVLTISIMDPIGASGRWEWHGYHNSFIEIEGRSVQSVSSDGWRGGGLRMSSRDIARFGLLHLRRGWWRDQRLVSEAWLRRALAPTPLEPTHGYMWRLNTGRRLYPGAPANSYFARGAGANLLWIDPEHDIVAVVRWIDEAAVDGFIQRVLAAVQYGAPPAR